MNEVLSCRNSTISSTLFSVEIGKTKRNVFSVMDAIDDLIIHYNVENNLSNVITPKCIQQYNKGNKANLLNQCLINHLSSSLSFQVPAENEIWAMDYERTTFSRLF